MNDKHNAVLQLLDVLKIQYKDNTQIIDKNRTFCAISIRKSANTTIKSNKQILRLYDRSLTFFPSNTPYFRQSLYDDMIVLHFNSSIPLFNSIYTVYDYDYDTVLQKFEKALSVWEGHNADKYYTVSAILYEIVAVLYKSSNHTIYSKQMQCAMNFINANIDNPTLSVNDIATHLNICPTTLRNLFNRETGYSPKQYIIHSRMMKAASMINSGYWSITQIAPQIGYYDQKNFSTAFKKHFGYSPSMQKYNYHSED